MTIDDLDKKHCVPCEGGVEPLDMAAAKQIGNLDGLTQNNGSLYVSDWISGDLFKVTAGEREKLLTLKPGLADISSRNGVLFAPLMMDGVVRAWKI